MITDTKIESVHHHPMLHWSAIFAGAFVALGLGFLLNLFGMAIGLSAYHASPEGSMMIAIGGILGLVIGTVVTMGVAGFVVGHLMRAHHCCCHSAVLYGFVTWSLALVLTALLVSPLTKYTFFYEHSLSPITAVATSTVTSTSTPGSMPSKQAALMQTTNHEHLTGSAWVIFGLFFLGGLSSCVGACCGMGCKRHEETVPVDTLH